MSNQAFLWAVVMAGGVVAGAYAVQAAVPGLPATKPAETAPAAQVEAAARGEGERPSGGERGVGRASVEGRGAATAPGRAGRGAPAAAPASLENAMSDMNRMLQDLKRVAADPAQADQALRDIATMERDVAISKLLPPPSINRIAKAEDKAQALTSYRGMMNGITKTLLDLEDAINDKKPEEIKKLLGELGQIEKVGHQEFNVRAD